MSVKKFPTKSEEGYQNYLKGMYFGILKDYEKGKDFENLLDSILIELQGLAETHDGIYLNQLYNNTASLRYLRYKFFRNVVLYKCMPLVDAIFKEG